MTVRFNGPTECKWPCPYCGTLLIGATAILTVNPGVGLELPGPAAPKMNDITICGVCHEILRFGHTEFHTINLQTLTEAQRTAILLVQATVQFGAAKK
jgi:hypothetical protein